jgi:hypothetical protein
LDCRPVRFPAFTGSGATGAPAGFTREECDMSVMKWDFIATLDDGEEFKVSSDARDLRRWEAAYSKTMVGETLSFTYLAQICYLAMRRTGMVDARFPTYDQFDARCVDLDIKRVNSEDDQLVGNPTPSEATEDSSLT